MPEGIRQLSDYMEFLFCQFIGIGRIHRGEVAVQQIVDLIADGDGFVFIVDLIQQQTVVHAEFGTAQDLLAFQLEEDHGDCLVHPGGQQLVFFGVLVRVGTGELDFELVGVAVLVNFVGEDRQGTQADAVTGFDHIQIVVPDGVAQNRGHQGTGAGSGAHPQNIVIAPLDVYVVGPHQRIHNDIRTGPPVENITHNVQIVHNQRLDHLADGFNHIGGLTNLDGGVDHVFIQILSGATFLCQMDQLVQDLLIIGIHVRTDFGTSVLGGDIAAQIHQTVNGEPVPLIQILVFISNQSNLGLGIVDQGSQIIPVPLGHGVAEKFFQLFFHFAGTGVQNMQEGFVFAMDIRHKVFCALGQIQNGLQTDDFRTGGLNGGILFGKQAQIMQLLGGKIAFIHKFVSFPKCFYYYSNFR